VAEVQLVISKGFSVVSPYGGIGYRRVSARATFGEPVATSHSVDTNHGTLTVGARVTLLPLLRLVGEVRQTSTTSFFFGVGVGL
jgi:opacity protein-like surface antigen